MNETALRESAANSPAGNAQLSQPASETGLRSESEPNSVTWGPAALEQRRKRTRDHLTKIAARREDWRLHLWLRALSHSSLTIAVEGAKAAST